MEGDAIVANHCVSVLRELLEEEEMIYAGDRVFSILEKLETITARMAEAETSAILGR